VGLDVGAVVGVAVGRVVGEAVGDSVGDIVGAGVGYSVGDGVGSCGVGGVRTVLEQGTSAARPGGTGLMSKHTHLSLG
jgi:hypothetical protein